jgi:hypothetical protein
MHEEPLAQSLASAARACAQAPMLQELAHAIWVPFAIRSQARSHSAARAPAKSSRAHAVNVRRVCAALRRRASRQVLEKANPRTPSCSPFGERRCARRSERETSHSLFSSTPMLRFARSCLREERDTASDAAEKFFLGPLDTCQKTARERLATTATIEQSSEPASRWAYGQRGAS